MLDDINGRGNWSQAVTQYSRTLFVPGGNSCCYSYSFLLVMAFGIERSRMLCGLIRKLDIGLCVHSGLAQMFLPLISSLYLS